MLDIRSKKLLGTLTLIAVVAVTLVMAPYTLLDPINLPKLCVLAFFSIVVLSLFAPSLKNLFDSDFKILTLILALFSMQITFVLFFSGANFGGQMYGAFGRNTGALAYLSLAALLLGSSIISDLAFLKRFVFMTLFVGISLILYGNIQYLNLEPFPFVNAYTINAPIGTFGNPDFQSAFMGMIAVVSFTMVLNKGNKLALRLGLVLVGLASLVVVYETIAKQGYLNFVAGAGVVTILWLFMTKRKSLGIMVSALGAIGGGLVFLGLVNAGPLANFLYKDSLAARGFYWRAAVKMLIEHPFFGVGMDGFIDWYRRSRAEDYSAQGFTTVSNTAHNVYLDLATNGGFPLIAIYFALIILVIISIVRVVRRSNGFEVYFVTVVGAWVAYQTQAFVSINQLGLATWGWVLSGLIIGYEINTRNGKLDNEHPIKRKQNQNKIKPIVQPLSPVAVMRVFAGVILGAIVAIPPYYANASFFSALKSNNIKTIQAAAYLKPIDERRLLHVATILRDNKMESEAISVLRDATKGYPDSFDLWQLWSTIPTSTPNDIVLAKAQLKRLDPFNPDIK